MRLERAEGNETQIPKQSVSEFVSRIIPYKQGYNTPQLALGFIPVITNGLIKNEH